MSEWSTMYGLNILANDIHDLMVSKGFWEDEHKNVGELIALMHSELSEALEAARHGDPPSDHIPEYSGVEEELADCIIRILDAAGGLHLDIDGALRAKMAFNAGRPYKHGKQF